MLRGGELRSLLATNSTPASSKPEDVCSLNPERLTTPSPKRNKTHKTQDRPYPTPESPFWSVNQEHCLGQQTRPLISTRNISSPGPQRAVMGGGGGGSESAASQQLAGVTQTEGPPEDPRPLAQHPGALQARSRPDFLAPPASSAKPLRGQLGKGAEGSGTGRWLLRAAGSTVAGEGARAHPTFGCLL